LGEIIPAEKKQHYVPIFYLKQFSEDNVYINSYLVGDDKYLENIPLKSQCCDKYFYSKDTKIEKELSVLESNFSIAIKSISDDEVFFENINNLGLLNLKAFIVIQYQRTKDKAENLNSMLNQLGKQILKYFPKSSELDISQDDFNLRFNEPAMIGLSYSSKLIKIVLDLKLKMLIANTNINFITSDSPIIIYNILFEKYFPQLGNGFPSKGCIIFCPISSKKMLILYDSNIYKIGSRKSKIIHTDIEENIKQLNGLQIANSNTNIYYQENKDRMQIEEIKKRFLKQRREKTLVQTFKREKADVPRKIIGVSRKACYTNLDLTFVKILKKRLDNYFPVSRDVRISELIRDQGLFDD